MVFKRTTRVCKSICLQRNNKERKVTEIFYSTCILPILDLGTDVKLHYATTQLVRKFLTATVGLKMGMDFRGKA